MNRPSHSQLFLADEAATLGLAGQLAQSRPAHGVLYLHGDLGAGKSTLARGLLRALGVDGAIRSPTYTLVERYPLAQGEALHLDLYRIADVAELDYLGLDDADARLWLVEWPPQTSSAIPAADLQVQLQISGQGRCAQIEAHSPIGQQWLKDLAQIAQKHRV